MKDSRFRVPVDTQYVESLGRATYVFSTLEWNAVWCCERLKPGYLRQAKKKTAGQIATDFLRISNTAQVVNIRNECTDAAQSFQNLVRVRNSLMHGKPGSSAHGEQALFSDGAQWTASMIDDAADRFTACSLELNRLLHEVLK